MNQKDNDPTQTVRVVTDADALRAQLPPRAAIHLYPHDGHKVVTLSPNDTVVVGRHAPADVVVNDSSISRQHARFSFDGDSVGIEDLGSTNGTRVNGAAIAAGERVAIGPDDDVMVGHVVVVIHRLSRGERRPTGFDTHERLTETLRDEILRARHYNRSVSLMFIAAKKPEVHVSTFAPEVQKHLRAVDRIALYSPQVLEVLLPEYRATEARKLAEQIVGARGDLAVGIVAFPDEGDSVDRMLAAARAALSAARGDKSGVAVVDSGPRAVENDDAPVALAPEMQRLFSQIERVARRADAVLITGETGSGKEVVAQLVHSGSPRAAKPIVSMNCGALNGDLLKSALFGHVKGAFTGADKDKKGIFESADGGTVFLDEIGELPAEAQVLLLRVLETRKVARVGALEKEIPFDVTVVFATHRDLPDMCAEGSFRLDLFHRINALTLHVPPLRQRREEIPHLAERFLQRADDERRLRGFDPAALAALNAYDWPGNVRELKNAVDRAVVLAAGDVITVDDLPDAVRRAANSERTGAHDVGNLRAAPPSRSSTPPPMPAFRSSSSSPSSPSSSPSSFAPPPPTPPQGTDLKAHMKATQAAVILRALEEHGAVKDAAAALGVPVRTLNHQMRQLGIRRDKNRFVVGDG